MSDLKKAVTEYLSDNATAKELMHEDYTKEFTPVVDGATLEFKSVDSYGGEGCGDTYYNVVQFRDTSNPDDAIVTVKLNGFYASHYGTDYHDYNFVEPKQKTITVWE